MNCKYCKMLGCVNYGEDWESLCPEYSPQTNADRIRAMSDEELAEFLNKFFWGRRKEISPFNIEKWLRQPVKDGED